MSEPTFEVPEDDAVMMLEANELFNRMCQQRHEMGEETYGHDTFMNNNTIEMALEELVDFSNYARYTFVKMYVLGRKLDQYLIEQGLKDDNTVSTGTMEDEEDTND
jgi:hypothetical protein